MLNVCEKCSSYGRVVGRIKREQPVRARKKQEKPLDGSIIRTRKDKETDTMQLIVSNYSELIKKGRERLGLKQEDFAKKIAEKESVVHKLESGQIKPNIDLARKLERFLKVALIEEVEIEGAGATGSAKSTDNLTIGDLINVK